MKKTFTPLVCGILLLSFAACKKSQNNPSSGSLNGNYKLLSVKAHTYTSTVETDPGSSEILGTTAVANFTSINNAGSVDVTTDSMRSINISYDVNTTLHGAEFIDGLFIDSVSLPFVYSVPSTSTSSAYRLVGKDSLYFPAGFMNSVSGGAIQSTIASGATYTLSGNNLTLTVTIPPTIDNSQPYTTTTESGTETVLLQRQ